MNNKFKVHLTSIILIISIFLIGLLFSAQQRMTIYVSSFGFLALFSIIFVVSIPMLIKLKRNLFTIYLLSNRRWIGIYTFIFALIHVFLVNNNFLQWNFSKILENPYLIIGAFAFFMLLLLAITSNNISVTLLGRNWKRLHMLIYVILILVILHSFNIGAIFMKNYAVRIIIILIILLVIVGKVIYKYKSKKLEQNLLQK